MPKITSSKAIATALLACGLSVARYNNFGLGSDANSTLRVAHSVVTANGTAVVTAGGGAILSYGDNDINGNTVDYFGTLTPIFTH